MGSVLSKAQKIASGGQGSTHTDRTASTSLSPAPKSLKEIKAEIDLNLQKHVVSKWLPRCVSKDGGFHQDYSVSWQPTGPGERSVVYQARNVWLSARAVNHTPGGISEEEKARLIGYSRHGVDFLSKKQWDSEHGGFYWKLDKSGKPVLDGEKHAYGISFTIYALAESYKATQDAAALDLAKQAFQWLEKNAHDEKNSGYFEAFTRTGKPIVGPVKDRKLDSIGTLYGYRSMNSHIHLLEAFTPLHEIWPEESLVKERLIEVFHLVREKVVVPEAGVMNLYFTQDWKPVPDHDSFGHDVETAYLLIEAAEALHLPEEEQEETWTIARRLVDHALEYGWDTKLGGFYDAGTTFTITIDKRKVWWISAEGLNALAVMHEKYGKETQKYWDAFVKTWAWIRKYQIDEVNGGWIAEVAENGKREEKQRKSDEWTEGYHQGRALMNVSAILGRLEAEGGNV